MKSKAINVILWLFVLNLGIAFGAGIYEHRVEFPLWLVATNGGSYVWNAKAANAANSGLRFWAFISTGPLTILTIINLVLAWGARGSIRKWWLSATVVALAERVLTFSYFIPTMVSLMQDETLSISVAVKMAYQWGLLNNLRHILVLVAWVCALKTFKQFGNDG
jgi:hypothetical protein